MRSLNHLTEQENPLSTKPVRRAPIVIWYGEALMQ